MPTAVLLSGGLDSAVLLAEEAARDTVQPIYVSVGLAWEQAERLATARTPDEVVYLPGRNIVLLGKAGVFCAAAGIGRLAIGSLDHNPFPDATAQFRETFAAALSLGLAHRLDIVAPYARVEKAEVIRRAAAHHVPLELTLSCMNPAIEDGIPRHCGLCSKCRERHDAFLEARVIDPTDYCDRKHMQKEGNDS
jgi:7-cyano-7-deazaguanine synthase